MDYTTVLTAAIAAGGVVAGGLIGLVGSGTQARVEIRRIDAEADRQRREHDEAHFRHRQALYHNLLDTAHRFHQDAGGIEPFERPADYHEWAHEWEHRLNAVRLFGTKRVSDEARNLATAIENAMGAAPNYDGETENRFLQAYENVIATMRDDIAPDRD